MTTVATEKQQTVVKFVQELLLYEQDRSQISPSLIGQKIDLVVAMQPAWGVDLDRVAVTDELIRRFSLWIGNDTTLQNDKGHVPWLTSTRKQDWRYWQRYRDWLESRLSWIAVDALDRSTDTILALLEDPDREDAWDRRGLVVGHVQSGKTSNYSGLICKAADAGYKIIIVLAGMHNNLRSQTQIRLDEAFLGFVTTANQEIVDFIGVGKDGRDAGIKPNCATNRAESGDFNRRVARHLAITPEQRPWLFVVKKNKSVLTLLLSWIRNHAANSVDQASNRKIVTHLPLLMIDDEADHASVDTGEQLFDANGLPDEDHQPKAINSLIRKILHSFTRSAYVGYTATPFANIFIHERGTTREEGPDLFPAAFIHNLAASSDYVGPSKVFGLPAPGGSPVGLPLVRSIDDQIDDNGHEAWMPVKHKNGHLPRHLGTDAIPPSLVTAIDSFLLSCVARSLRGQAAEHCSMLVHVTRFNSVQAEVRRQVDNHVRHLRQRIVRRIDHEEIITRLRNLWESDYLQTFDKMRVSQPDETSSETPAWDAVENELTEVIADIEVRMINGTAKDALDYAENRNKGLKVIAIGGDKLARGLTLEGLCTSYFLRASKMYDTLMQMGRWFGYRPDYLDLCRLFTTQELSEWFGHIADSAEELREEFDLMAASGATPRDYGLKVQSHPILLVTSQLKMRSARNLQLSFSGQLLETVALYREKLPLQSNLEAAKKLVEAIGTPAEWNPRRPRAGRSDSWEGFLWRDVSARQVMDFLSAYKTHPAAHKVNSLLLAEFVQAMAACRELTSWTVAFIGGGTGRPCDIGPDMKVKMNRRTGDDRIDRYSIGRLLDPKDEGIDLNESEWLAALAATKAAWRPDPARRPNAEPPETPNGPAIRHIRGFGAGGVPAHREKGLLILYALDPEKAFDSERSDLAFPSDTPPVIAFGISFPGSNSGMKVEYKVNNVLWELEYGPAE
jgi:hypothetical protein